MTQATTTHPQSLELSELKDIEARAERVSALLRKSATLWLEIAREVFDAKKILSAEAFGIFLQKACLTPGIADKMPTIAKASELYSDEAKKHIQKLEGWSTLYEVAKLTSPEKQEYFKALDADPEIDVSRAFIQSFRKTKSQIHSQNIQIAQIRVSKADITRLDCDQFIEMKQKLDDIAHIFDRLSPVVSISINNNHLSEIENIILNANTDSEHDEHCDDLLPVTMPVATNSYSISEVAY